MSALQKLRNKRKVEELVQATQNLSIKKRPKADYLDESLVSEITDNEENNEYDIEDNFEGQEDYDKNELIIDYVDEDVLGEEKAAKNYMIDNRITFQNDIILSVYFKNICKQFGILDEDNRFDVQRAINSLLYKTRNKSINDEIVLTALEMFNQYNNFIKISSLSEFITILINIQYLKFPSITSSSFIDTSSITNVNDIHRLYSIIFKNANDFIEKLSGEKLTKVISEFDIRKPITTEFINLQMNPDLIRHRDFDTPPHGKLDFSPSSILFKELLEDITVINKFRYASILNHFVSIINLSSRTDSIKWDKSILDIDAPEITDIPILIRKMISVQTKKYSNFEKDDLIQVLYENPNLITNIKKFFKMVKLYNEKKTKLHQQEKNKNRENQMDVDKKVNPFGNLFIKKRKI